MKRMAAWGVRVAVLMGLGVHGCGASTAVGSGEYPDDGSEEENGGENGGEQEEEEEGSGTQPTSYGPPILVSPANGAHLGGLGAELAFVTHDGATQYQVQVRPYNDDGPGIDLIRNIESSYTVESPVMGYGPYVMLPDMTYSWRVRTTAAMTAVGPDDAAWGPWSDTRTFTTASRHSGGITQVSPPNGTVVLSTASLNLRWSNANNDVFLYEVQVSRDPTFNTDPATATSFVWWNIVHGGDSAPLNSWWTPILPASSTIYWRVRPRVQGDGSPVAWSQTWSFRTQ